VSQAVRSLPFIGLFTAIVLGSLSAATVAVHVVPFLIERGISATVAAASVGLAGVMQVVGRLIFAVVGPRITPRWLAAAVFGLVAAGLAWLPRVHAVWEVILFTVLYGMGNGMVTLYRASRPAELFGPRQYGAISGVIGLGTTGARAIAPWAVGFLYTRVGGYEPVLEGIAAGALFATGAAFAAEVAAARGRLTPRAASPARPT
jgi:cyanate permease